MAYDGKPKTAPSTTKASKVATIQIAEVLNERILSGEIPAGDRLKESILAQEFGVSRNTVRGALTVLEYEGLTDYSRNRGWMVWKPTVDDLLDVYLTRFYLETAAARNISPGTSFDGLKEALDEMLLALDTDDDRKIVEADLGFHTAIIALMGSQRLNEYYVRLSRELKYSLFILSTSEHFGEREDWRQTHLDIYFALTSGDPERAVKAVGDAILESREDLIRSLTVPT
ncbi:MAG: GntR family transcriptional regulator [Leucobacter sp.]